jgi:hypothetical protein
MLKSHASLIQNGERQHPWRLKKSKQKKMSTQQFYLKAVHLLDKPSDEHISPDNYISDYSIKDEMVLLKCYIEIGTEPTESEIRGSITEVCIKVCLNKINNNIINFQDYYYLQFNDLFLL